MKYLKQLVVVLILFITTLLCSCYNNSNPISGDSKVNDDKQQIINVVQTIHIIVQNKATNELSTFEAISFNIDNDILTIQITLTTIEIVNLNDYYISGFIL